MNSLRLLKPFTNRNLFNITSVKYISQHHLKFSDIQEKWQEKDGVSKHWQLIYKSPMGNVLNFGAAYLTASTSILAASGLYYSAFVFDVSTINDPVLLDGEVVIANNATECLIYVGAFIIFHTAVRLLLSRLVVRMYKKDDEYIAIFSGHWYNSIIKHKFHLEEFKNLSPTYVVPWGNVRFGLGKKTGILIHEYFKTPEYMNYLIYKKKCD